MGSEPSSCDGGRGASVMAPPPRAPRPPGRESQRFLGLFESALARAYQAANAKPLVLYGQLARRAPLSPASGQFYEGNHGA